jgi:signal peptidase II
MTGNPRPITIYGLLAIGIAAIDQIVKEVIDRQVGQDSVRHERWLVGDWLGISYAENSGVAFGLFRGHSTMLLALATLAVMAAIGGFLYAHRNSAAVLFAGALIAGGSVGNVVDRIRLGYVRDFFAVGPWPQFNLADAAITIGVVIALFSTMREEKKMDRNTLAARARLTENRRAITDVVD